MNYYLIDYKNLKNIGIIKNIQKGDTVICFYSSVCVNMNLDLIEHITSKGATFTCQKVMNGTKNALDFQLSSYLGSLISKKSSNVNFHIVSNDKGYDYLCSYWATFGKVVDRISATPNTPIEKEAKKTAENTPSVIVSQTMTEKDITPYIDQKQYVCEVAQIFNEHKTKSEIHSALQKKFKGKPQMAGIIYRELKPLFVVANKK